MFSFLKMQIPHYFLVGFFCLLTNLLFAQQEVDSLIVQYEKGQNEGSEFEILKKIAEDLTDPDSKIQYSELLIQKASEDSAFQYLHSGYLQKGNALQLKGDYAMALDAYFQSIKYAKRIDEIKGVGAVSISVADTYNMIGNPETSEEYYQKGIEILRTTNDSINLASALLNAGDQAFNSGKYEKALDYFKESGIIFKKIEYLLGTAYNLGNVGMVYAQQGKNELAEKNINQAINMLEDMEQYYPISVYLRYMSDIYKKKSDYSSAVAYTKQSLNIAKNHGLKDQVSDAYLQLAELDAGAGDYQAAYKNYQNHIVFRDSVRNLETIQQMAELRNDHEIAQKQVEVDLMTQRQRNQKVIVIATLLALLSIVIIAIGLYRRNLFIKKTSAIIEKEKTRSDNLLLNILPEETARELKDFGRVKSKKFESVSVLFIDFMNFTSFSENLSPEILVESVDFYFSKFDEIMGKYGLEKIKTIGDCYMCAGGIPFPTKDHAHKVALAAFEICAFMKNSGNIDHDRHVKFEARIGINTGPVIAGVVGSKKFAYDIWGDTVNIASRMESNSEAGRINISQNTYILIKDNFNCEYRGEIKVKNKGMMKMYYLNSNKNLSQPHSSIKAALV